MEFIAENIDLILKVVGAVLAAVLALPKAKEWKAKASTFVAENHLSAAQELALGIVANIYNNVVRELKKTVRFDDLAKQRVFDHAKAEIVDQLKANGIKVAKEVVPYLIEMAVNRMKGEARYAKPFTSLPVEPLPASDSMPLPVEPGLTAVD